MTSERKMSSSACTGDRERRIAQVDCTGDRIPALILCPILSTAAAKSSAASSRLPWLCTNISQSTKYYSTYVCNTYSRYLAYYNNAIPVKAHCFLHPVATFPANLVSSSNRKAQGAGFIYRRLAEFQQTGLCCRKNWLPFHRSGAAYEYAEPPKTFPSNSIQSGPSDC